MAAIEPEQRPAVHVCENAQAQMARPGTGAEHVFSIVAGLPQTNRGL